MYVMSSAQTWLARSMAQPAQGVREHRVRRVLLARVGLAVQRLDAHAPHQRAHVPAADLDALQAQQVAQHAAARERVLQVQLVDAPHQRQLGLGDRLGVVVHRASADAQQLACRLIGSSWLHGRSSLCAQQSRLGERAL
jgi:hypothetical protein